MNFKFPLSERIVVVMCYQLLLIKSQISIKIILSRILWVMFFCTLTAVCTYFKYLYELTTTCRHLVRRNPAHLDKTYFHINNVFYLKTFLSLMFWNQIICNVNWKSNKYRKTKVKIISQAERRYVINFFNPQTCYFN